MRTWIRFLTQSRPNRRRRQIRSAAAIESLEPRQMLAAVNVQPGDIILQRNYRPPGQSDVDSGLLIYHPATGQTTPLVIPRLNDPANINYGIYVDEFELTWDTAGQVAEPHLIFTGTIVPNPAQPSVGQTGVFDFDLNAGTLTSIRSESASGDDPSHSNLALTADGLLARTRYTDSINTPRGVIHWTIDTLDESVTYFQQDIDLAPGTSGIIYHFDGPTTSLDFDAAGTLYAAFGKNDGFEVVSEDTEVVGNAQHPSGIYRLTENDPSSRELVYAATEGFIHFQFATDGTIVALVGDNNGSRYYKRDSEQERVIRINPLTNAVQTLFVGAKKFDYEDLQLDSAGNVFLAATDNSKDGNTNIFQLVNSGKKKPKIKAVQVFQDDPSGGATYGVITGGNFHVVKSAQTPVPEAASEVTEAEQTSRAPQRHLRRHQRQAPTGKHL